MVEVWCGGWVACNGGVVWGGEGRGDGRYGDGLVIMGLKYCGGEE